MATKENLEMRASILRVMANSSDPVMATWRVRKCLGDGPTRTKHIRAELVKMEKDGLVKRNERYGRRNNFVWELLP